MTGFVYHRIPENMIGETLYPLNALREQEPEVYAKAAAKYSWRKELMAQVVTPLGCLWNDVIHLTPLHPKKTLEAYQAIVPVREQRVIRFVAIPIAHLDPERTCWFHPSPEIRESPTKLHESEFSPFNQYQELKELSPAQVDRWREDFNLGRPVLLWSATPHVLHAGPITISGLEQFEVSLEKDR